MSEEGPSSSDVYQEYCEFYDLYVGDRLTLPTRRLEAGFRSWNTFRWTSRPKSNTKPTGSRPHTRIDSFGLRSSASGVATSCRGELEQLADSQGIKVLEVSTGYRGDAPQSQLRAVGLCSGTGVA